MPLTKGASIRKAVLCLDASSQQLDMTSTARSSPSPGRSPSTPPQQGPVGTSTPQFGSWYVRPDSLTPYSDATNCRHSKRKTPAGKSTAGGGGVRRPMNAFMVWSQIERRRISAADPSLHNAEISRRLGARWRRLSAAERRPYAEEADRLRVLHAVEFPDYKYTPRKNRKTRPVSARRQATAQRAATNRKPLVDDVTQLPADAYDSEVSLYFATGSVTMLAGRRSSKHRGAGGRRIAVGKSGSGSGRSNLPPTPDSSAQYRTDRQLFRVIAGDIPCAASAAPTRRASKHSSRSRFEFPAVASTSDVQFGSFWTETVALSGGDNDSTNDVDALDTPISLELDASTARSLFDDQDSAAPSYRESTTPAGDVGGGGFCVDYCTPEVAAIVRDDWLEETIHNDALL